MSSTIKLPVIAQDFDSRKKGFLIIGLFFAIYNLLGRWQIFSLKSFTLDIFDTNIPFIPYSIYVYMSHIPYITIGYLMIAYFKEKLNAFIYSYTVLGAVSSLIFLFYPVRLPHEFDSFFQETQVDIKTTILIRLLHNYDVLGCSFPSQHVLFVLLIILHFIRSKYLWIFLFWGGLIIVSTLTFKRHYFVDVIASIVLTFMIHWFFYYKVTYYDNRSKRT